MTRDFGFEWVGVDPPKKDGTSRHLQRVLLESDPRHRAQLVFGKSFLPTVACLDDRLYSWRTTGTCSVQKTRWAFLIDSDHFSEFSDRRVAREYPLGIIQFDLASYLEGAMTPERPAIAWHPAIRALTLTKQTGAKFTLRFRSPNDAEQFGTSLSELAVRASNGATIRWFGFLIKYHGGLRIRLDPAKWEEAGAAQSDEKVDDTGNLRKSWELVSRFENRDNRLKESRDPRFRNRCQVMMAAFTKFAKGELQECVEKASIDSTAQLRIAADARDIIAEMRAAREIALAGISGETVMRIDDPILRWRAFELAVDPDFAAGLRNGVFQLLSTAPLRQEVLSELCDEFGKLGTPTVESDSVNSNSDPSMRFYAAILASHYQWEFAAREVEACVAKLTDANRNTAVERVAIEALIRMDLLEKIPADQLAAWFRAEAIEADQPTRTESLRILSLAPQGQRYLMNLATSDDLSTAVRADILEMLVYRAEATLRTQRFDFLSRSDCEKILAEKRKFEPSQIPNPK
jgi:hypothetical protein